MTLYVVGDVQGCADAFDKLLTKIRFRRRRDELWLVGDLVNRGPSSRDVLRTVMALGDRVTCVLGNHDLHLLATAAGVRDPSATDTFHDILRSSDAEELLNWLRARPLVYRDKARRKVLVHAGIPPIWKVKHAMRYAAEIEALLRDAAWESSLRDMYGETPTQWKPTLKPAERRRFTVNALTRMRYCDARGRLDFTFSGAPGTQPGHLMPWFDVPGKSRKKWHIVFGHWSALGVLLRDDLTAVDSGCVWGGELTAVPLDPEGPPVSVACAYCGP
jgi:bis(5'-nucleosyl)-tetraphosphatase (symmetrical)